MSDENIMVNEEQPFKLLCLREGLRAKIQDQVGRFGMKDVIDPLLTEYET